MAMGNFRNEYRRQKEEIVKRQYLQRFTEANRGIEKVEAHLHKMSLSSTFDYERIVQAIGPIFKLDRENPQALRYKFQYVRNFNDFKLKIFLGPIPNPAGFYGAKSYFILLPKGDISLRTYRDFLTWINQKIPLKVSLAEYSIDQFCGTPEMVRHLYFIERRFMVVKGQSISKSFGGQEYNIDSEFIGMKNRVTHFKRDDKGYERGDDDDKDAEGWEEETLNRVRLEHTLSKYERTKYGIGHLYDFIENPHFGDINRHRWRFKQFMKGKYPRYWHLFETPDANSFKGTMMNEVIKARSENKQINSYLGPIAELEPIELRLSEACDEFDRKWGDDSTTTVKL
jgi:hypothetical protein